jgi:3-hydroxyacyl-[acyl-carrier-protein] dehydratase
MLGHADIRALMPHRHPVLLVDRVIEVVPGERIVAEKAITGSEPCYAELAEGLGQEAFAYPRSMLVESFGQAGGVLWAVTRAARGGNTTGMPIFATLRDCVFSQEAFPGDVVRHVVWIDQLVGDNIFLKGEMWLGDERLAEIGSVLAVLRPRDRIQGAPA